MRLLSLILPAFAASAAVPPTALVFGHKIPDTDAICAALDQCSTPSGPHGCALSTTSCELGLGSLGPQMSRFWGYRVILDHVANICVRKASNL